MMVAGVAMIERNKRELRGRNSNAH